jgi:uncharacterized protein with PIN domain
LKCYIDTSVLAAYYCPESLSEKAQEFLTSHPHPGVSALTEVELFSAVSRKVREGGISRGDARRILAQFTAHLDKDFYDRLSLEPHHYRLARDWIGMLDLGLRSLCVTAHIIPSYFFTIM